MLVLIWVLLFLSAACLILFMPALWGKHIYNEYRGTRTVNCPETHQPVTVRFNALRAAFTGLTRTPQLTLADCSRWPDRASCDQACIPDAAHALPDSHAASAHPAALRIAHLPALLATGVIWVLGVVWHSEYVFRSQWAKTVGLTDQQAHDLARTWMPHLLTVAVCLMFSYCVAVFLAWIGTRTLWRGLQISLSLWLLIAVGLLVANQWNFGPNFLWIEGGYTLLAAILVGIIVGAVPRRLLLGDVVADREH
ncbi:MAG TPA: DUF1761 domain-containing protein [Terriglobales bacterium]|nr:DUF1761 domain-containing protein [Terriglobales bacterium]